MHLLYAGRNWRAGTTLRGGDANGDGSVDVRDLAVLGDNYGLAGPQGW